MTTITPLSATIRIFVFKVANRFWQRLISISMRVFQILCLIILNVLASHPPSNTLAFRIPQNLSIGRSWGELRKVWSTGYKRNFKLVKEILSFIDIVGTSKVGPEKIIPICMVLLKERYEALFYSPPYTYFLSANLFLGIKNGSQIHFSDSYTNKELLRVLRLGHKSNFF